MAAVCDVNFVVFSEGRTEVAAPLEAVCSFTSVPHHTCTAGALAGGGRCVLHEHTAGLI